jgi:hypothetical protein
MKLHVMKLRDLLLIDCQSAVACFAQKPYRELPDFAIDLWLLSCICIKLFVSLVRSFVFDGKQ